MNQYKETQNHWIFSDIEFLKTPNTNLKSKLSEHQLRIRACRYLDRCAAKLKIQKSLTTIAKILMNRFYMKRSFDEHGNIFLTL